MTKLLVNNILQHPILCAENQKGINTVQQCFIENQNGINTVQQCFIENQKGAIAVEFVQQ